ncbi:penicillin-binding transpeptidase domain-containing protein [Thermodesulfobacteriota bacterium]
MSKGYHGGNLVLTIDCTIQYITEKILEETATEFSAKSGMAIVMQPETGAILALAHFPFFNPNSFAAFRKEMWRNRAITDPFEPGSTMKIFSAAAALESGACKPGTTFFCEKGAYRIGEDIVHDTSPHEWLSLQEIVKYSSNIGAVKVTEKVGAESLYNSLRGFGFGEKTGIDCPGETTGSLLKL